MKAFRLSLKIIFTIFLFRLLTGGVYAQSDSYAVESLCEYAKSLYEQGGIEEAKHEFSKVLIIDPDNATAKRYLQKMGLGKGTAEKPKALKDSSQAKDAALANLGEELKLTKEQLGSATAKRDKTLTLKDSQLKGLTESLKSTQSNLRSEEHTSEL